MQLPRRAGSKFGDIVNASDQGRGAAGAGAHITPEELDRERLVTYLDWAEVQGLEWYLPLYAVLVTGWIASYDLDVSWLRTLSAGVFVVAMLTMVRVVTTRTGVSFPRFKDMPAALRRTYWPFVIACALVFVLYLAMVAFADDVPFWLLGLVAGPVIAGAAALQARAFRREARRLAREQGIAP